ncbi:hypothetical protein [Sphingobium xenophagum]|uniref:hypothetical protein n=1 Tax=Sphingobium xenophagum TaxID=121428 RepID=UPI000370F02F|nr:hypothetical protein [Sphingobium xenophagum]
MTTTITVVTHGWPVAVTTSSEHNHSDERQQSHGYHTSTVFVEKGSKADFHISQDTQISVRELAADAEGLYSKDAVLVATDAAPIADSEG